MKIVPFYPNESDNLHCLQSCVKSVLSFYGITELPDDFDEQTGFFGSMPWSIHAVNFLYSQGLNVKLVTPFSCDRLVSEGEKYLEQFKGSQAFAKEKAEGQYNHLEKIRDAATDLISNNLWEERRMSISDIESFLSSENNLVIAKTVHEWLSGNLVMGASHFVTVIKEYNYQQWLIHDPGLPPVERRKVNKSLGSVGNIFGDIITIEGLR